MYSSVAPEELGVRWMGSRAMVGTGGGAYGSGNRWSCSRGSDDVCCRVKGGVGHYGVRYHGGDRLPLFVWQASVVSCRALTDARDLPRSPLDTGIDIISCSIWRGRQLVYISSTFPGECGQKGCVLDITRLIFILDIRGHNMPCNSLPTKALPVMERSGKDITGMIE